MKLVYDSAAAVARTMPGRGPLRRNGGSAASRDASRRRAALRPADSVVMGRDGRR